MIVAGRGKCGRARVQFWQNRGISPARTRGRQRRFWSGQAGAPEQRPRSIREPIFPGSIATLQWSRLHASGWRSAGLGVGLRVGALHGLCI